MSLIEERRREPRRRALLGGTLRYLCKTRTATCRIRNLSGGGARLETDNVPWLPDQFEIDIPHHDLRAPVKVVWRDRSSMGVVFIARKEQPGMSIREREQQSALRLERDRLAERVARLTDEF